MLFPGVKKCKSEREYILSFPFKVTEGSICGFSPAFLTSVFGEIHSDGNIVINACKTDSLSGKTEEYILSISENDGVISADIKASSDKGFVRALFTLKRMALKNIFTVGEIYDYPSFPVRGYIEGFYGKPWKAEERLIMLETMALFGENTHYYAPKDDPYHRNKWRELYPEEDSRNLRRLVDKARSLCVDFHYCIAPGLSMRYTCEDDINALFDKTKQLYSMGIKNFGLLLDDIPSELFYKEDKERFGNAAAAHVYLTKRYYEFLKSLSSEIKLTVCPTSYHGKGYEPELVNFAGNIPEDVSVFFTGCDICSKELTSDAARVFGENTGHKPLYWDNYPVNDAEMFMEMHMGPLIGRDSDLNEYSEGIISNCMEYFNCNMIPLITAAAYMWDSENYSPEEAYHNAVEFLLPEEERDDFFLLADQFRTSCLNDENSRIMGEYLSRASVCFQTGNFMEAVDTVSEYAEKVRLASKRMKNRTSPIYSELERWLKKFYLMSEILDISLLVLNKEDKKIELKEKMSLYNESATVLTAFCFREYIESVLSL